MQIKSIKINISSKKQPYIHSGLQVRNCSKENFVYRYGRKLRKGNVERGLASEHVMRRKNRDKEQGKDKENGIQVGKVSDENVRDSKRQILSRGADGGIIKESNTQTLTPQQENNKSQRLIKQTLTTTTNKIKNEQNLQLLRLKSSKLKHKKRPSIQQLTRKSDSNIDINSSLTTVLQDEPSRQKLFSPSPSPSPQRYKRKTCKMFNLGYRSSETTKLYHTATMKNLINNIEAHTYRQIEEKCVYADGREERQYKVFQSMSKLEGAGVGRVGSREKSVRSRSGRSGRSKSRSKPKVMLMSKKRVSEENRLSSQGKINRKSQTNKKEQDKVTANQNQNHQQQSQPNQMPFFERRRKNCRKSRFSQNLDNQKMIKLQSYMSEISQKDKSKEIQKDSLVQSIGKVSKKTKLTQKRKKTHRSHFKILLNNSHIALGPKSQQNFHPPQKKFQSLPFYSALNSIPKYYKWQNWTTSCSKNSPESYLTKIQKNKSLFQQNQQKLYKMQHLLQKQAKQLQRLEILNLEIRKLEGHQKLIEKIRGDGRKKIEGIFQGFVEEVKAMWPTGRGTDRGSARAVVSFV